MLTKNGMRDTVSTMIQQQPASRARRLLPVIGVMATIFLLSSRSSVPRLPGLSSETTALIGHLTAYALLALAVWTALAFSHLASGRRLILAFVATMAFGVTDEFHQVFVAGRTAGLSDLAVNAAGAGGLLLALWRRDHALADTARDV